MIQLGGERRGKDERELLTTSLTWLIPSSVILLIGMISFSSESINSFLSGARSSIFMISILVATTSTGLLENSGLILLNRDICISRRGREKEGRNQ